MKYNRLSRELSQRYMLVNRGVSERDGLTIVYRSAVVSIGDYHCRLSGPEYSREKLSTCCKVVFPRSGAFIKLSARRQSFADSTRILFFNRNEVYRTSHPTQSGDECTAFVFEPSVLTEMRGAYESRVFDQPNTPLPFDSCASDSQTFLAHLQLLRYAAREPQVDLLAIDEAAVTLVSRVLSTAYRSHRQPAARARLTTRQLHREFTNRVTALLARQFRERLSLAEIARNAHSSPFHLCRVFKRETGLSIHQYRNRLRLRAALELLPEYDDDLSRLALDLGFSSHSHMTGLFRREFRVSPSELRHGSTSSRLREISKNLKV